MALQIIRNNIVNVEADAIVNTANPAVGVGRGVDYAIYKAAGWDRLLAEREKIGEMQPGEAAYTPAFDLDAKYIIHTVGPAWRGGGRGERETVAKCYSASLGLARKLGCESIAFPLIATGTYGFPKDEALRIAIREISSFLIDNEMEVLLVVYDRESFEVSGKLFSDIRSFIGEREVNESRPLMSGTYNAPKAAPGKMFNAPESAPDSTFSVNEKAPRRSRVRELFGRHRVREEQRQVKESAAPREMEADIFGDLKADLETDLNADLDMDLAEEPFFSSAVSEDYTASFPPEAENYIKSFPSPAESLEDRISHMGKTFQEHLFMLIDRRGLTDPEVYRKANIDRKHFSKIRSNKDYMPGKRTALALAIALELSLDETKDLLARAGLTLSPSIVSDLIIGYCIETGNYDIYEINCILFKYGQQTLGA